jgi:hypothetical protein
VIQLFPDHLTFVHSKHIGVGGETISIPMSDVAGLEVQRVSGKLDAARLHVMLVDGANLDFEVLNRKLLRTVVADLLVRKAN